MKFFILISIFMSLVITVTIASQDLFMKVSRIDGLPHRLLESRLLDKEIASSEGAIDLTPVFNELACGIPRGGSIVFDSGSLIRNLDKESHDRVEMIIESLHRSDDLITSSRAYYNLLEPISAEKRFQKVMRIGFLPDPLVAGMLQEISSVRGLPDAQVDPFDPFAQPDPPAEPFTDEENARIQRLENTASALLKISMHRLKDRLAVIDGGNAESDSEE